MTSNMAPVSEGKSIEVEFPQQNNLAKPDAQVPHTQYIHAFWHSDLLREFNSKSTLVVMRTTEDVLSVFGPNWLKMCTRGSKYRPYDLNLPYTLPQIRFSNLVNDPPLTNFGRCYVHSVAKVFKNEQIRFARIFSGPSLRSVQMALIMAEYMGKTVEIVEDLKEPEAEEVPKYLTVEELKKCGYNVSEFVTSTTKSQVKSPNDLLQRLVNAIRNLSQIKGPVFISNGPLTLKLIESIADLPDGFVDPSANRPFKQPIFSTDDVKVDFTKFDFDELNEIVPFGSISAFEKQQDGSFIRWPYSLPKMTVHAQDVADFMKREICETKPEPKKQIVEENGSEIALEL